MSLRDLRQELSEALRDNLSVTVYEEVPQAASFPCVALYPSDPYLFIETIGTDALRLRADYQLVCIVADTDNKGSLDAIERLMVNTTLAMPAGVTLGEWSKPSQDSFGPAPILQSQMTIQVRTQQEAS